MEHLPDLAKLATPLLKNILTIEHVSLGQAFTSNCKLWTCEQRNGKTEINNYCFMELGDGGEGVAGAVIYREQGLWTSDHLSFTSTPGNVVRDNQTVMQRKSLR